MRAVLVEGFGQPPQLRDVPEPDCPADGVLVRVQATGLCRSDWHGYAGHDPDVQLPHVPGHEFAGVVHEVGAAISGWHPGDRVTAPFVNACGQCRPCRSGDHQVCLQQTQPGFTRWGSFAELVVVDRAMVNLIALPDAVDAVSAAALGCRYATAFRAVVQVGRVAPGEWVAVHGCGGVGLSAVQVAVSAGARVVAVDVRPEPLRLAAEQGAQACLNAAELAGPGDQTPDGTGDSVGAAVRELTAGGAALSLDALGSEGTCAASIGSLRPRGRHVQVGLLPEALGRPAVPMHLVIGRELELLGSHGMAAHSYPAMLALVASGRLRPDRLVTGRISLAEAGPALAAMGQAALGQPPPAGITVIEPGAPG